MGLASNGIMSGVSRGVLMASRGLSGIFPMQNGIINSNPSAIGYSVPAKVFSLQIEGWGGGAAGGNTGGANSIDGGGSGAYVKRNAKTVNAGDKILITLGLGGIKRPVGTYTASNGTATLVDGMSAGGGLGPDTLTLGTGGLGGTATGGDVNTSGENGAARTGSSGNYASGRGGNAPNGGRGGAAIAAGVNADGNDGNNPGGGGSGAGGNGGTPTQGGSGANGAVRFKWTEELLEDFEAYASNLPVGGLTWAALLDGRAYTSTDMVVHGSANAYFAGSGAGVGLLSNVIDL